MRAVGADRVFGSQGHCRIAYLSAGLPTLRGFAPGLAADDRGRMTRAGGRGPGHGRATHRQRYRHRDARVDRRLRQPPGGAQRQHNRPRRGSRPDDPQAVDLFRTPSSRAIQCDAGSHTVSLRRHLRAVITLEPLTTSTILSRESLRLTLPPDDTFLPGRLSQRASRHRMVTTMSTSCGPPTSWSARDEWRRTRQHSR
jgi:hypothetical protein